VWERWAVSIDLYFFRHGRTEWNSQGRYQGHADVDLDRLGRGQALAVAERCREIGPTLLLTSDLRRCSDVAARIAERTGVEAVPEPRLRERHVGQWSGLTRDEIAERFPDEYRRWRAGDLDVRPGGGETARELQDRIVQLIDHVVGTVGEGASVVAVTHAGWIRGAMHVALGPGTSKQAFGVPSQGSLTVLSHGEHGLRLEAYNDRGHLLQVEPVDQEPPAPMVL